MENINESIDSYSPDEYAYIEDEELGIENKEDDLSERPPAPDEAPISTFNDAEITDKDIEDLENGVYDEQIEAERTPMADMEFKDVATKKGLLTMGLNVWQGYTKGAEAAGAGIIEAGENILEAGAAGLDAVTNLVTEMEDPNYYSNMAKELELIPPEVKERLNSVAESSTGLALTKNFSQFLLPFGGLMKGIKIWQNSGRMPIFLQKTVGAGVAGAITDFAVWDYTDKRLTNFMTSFGDELLVEAAEEFKNNPDGEKSFLNLKENLGRVLTHEYVKALQYEEGDSELIARTKQAIEGFVVGNVVDVIMHTFGMYGRLKARAKGKSADNNTTSTASKSGENLKENEILIKGGGKNNVKETDTLVGETADAGIRIPEIEIQPQVQKEFNQALYTKNKDEAQKVLARALAPSLDSMKGIDSLQSFQDILDELIGNAQAAARSERQASKAAAIKSGKNDVDAAVDPEAYLEANAADDLTEYGAFTRDLTTVEFKAGVVDHAMGLHLAKAISKFGKDEITFDQMQEIANYSAFVSEQVRNPRSNMGAAFREIQNSKYETNPDGSFVLDANGKRKKKLTASNILKDTKLATANEALYRKMALQLENVDVNTGSLAADLTNSVKERDFVGAWAEAFINSALGPKTLGVQFISNGIILLTKTADVWAAALRSGKSAVGVKTVTAKQALAHNMGFIAGLYDGIKVMFKSFKTQRPEFSRSVNYVNEYHLNNKFSSQNLGFRSATPGSTKDYVNKSIDVIGRIIRSVPGGTNMMMASDEMFKIINHRSFIYQRAMRDIENSYSIVKQPKEFMEAFNKRIKDIQGANKLTAKRSLADQQNFEIHQEAMESAHFATLTSKWGERGEGLYKQLKDIPIFTFVVPFVRAPVNAALWTARTTPGLNLTAAGSRITKALQAGGHEAEMARAHLQVASLIWGFAMMHAFTYKDKLQGSTFSKDSREYRDMGIERTTYQNEEGDFVNYRGFEPQSARWALSANLMHQWMSLINTAGDQMTPQQVEDAAWQLIWDSSIYVLADFKDRSAFQGLERIMSAFDEGSTLRAENVLGGFLTGWISILSSQVKYMREKYLGEKAVKFDPDTPSEHIDARYGGGLSALQGLINEKTGSQIDIIEPPVPMLNTFGDPISASTSDAPWYLPSNITKTKGFESDAQKEVLRVKQALPNETVIGTVPTSINEVKLTNRERYNLLKFVKNFKDSRGHNLDEAFAAEFKKRSYQKLPDKEKATRIGQIYDDRMRIAKELLLLDGFAYNKGLKRPYATKLELLDYRRDEAISIMAQREQGIEHNRRVGKDDPKYIDLEKFIDKGDKKRTQAFRRARAIFRKLTK